MRKIKNFFKRDFEFALFVFVVILFLISPLLIRVPLLHRIISFYLEPLGSFKDSYIGIIGTVFGTFLGVIGALWTQGEE